jgi:peptidoglycan hydrolase-like protein with peptidoglycan-binding domain
MTTAQQVLAIAVGEIGYKESPPGSNHNKYGVWYGMDRQPWCAMFVSYCFFTADMPLVITTPKGFAFCPYGVNWFKNKGWWHTTPKVGDVVFYDWRGDGVSDHVGIVEKVNPNGSIIAIEGNTSVGNDSNGGQVMRRTRNAGIQGYGRPPYADEQNGSVHNPPPPPWPGRYISLTSPNMEGQDVLLWQRQMIYRGWNLEADSIFSERDHEVLVKFQQQKGLEVDGKIGPISWNKAWTSPITND